MIFNEIVFSDENESYSVPAENSNLSDNRKFLQLTALWQGIDDEMSCTFFNKIDREKLNALEDIGYCMICKNLVD